MTLNWKRILIFVFVLIVVTFAVGFTFGVVAKSGRVAPESLLLLQGLLAFVAITLVFVALGFVQRVQPILHALIVAVLEWLVSFPLNVLYGKQPVLQWALGVIALLIFALIGSSIGMLIHRATTKQDQI